MPAIEIPYHVRLQDPPVVPPEYGDEDAPRRQDLSFVEWLTHAAQTFRFLGTDRDKYLAGLIQAKVQLCQEHGLEDLDALVAKEREIVAEDNRCLMAALEMHP